MAVIEVQNLTKRYGDTVAEIASAYGATESKVKMTLARMREELKAVLTRGGVAL